MTQHYKDLVQTGGLGKLLENDRVKLLLHIYLYGKVMLS